MALVPLNPVVSIVMFPFAMANSLLACDESNNEFLHKNCLLMIGLKQLKHIIQCIPHECHLESIGWAGGSILKPWFHGMVF
jgi:hypothetical protein